MTRGASRRRPVLQRVGLGLGDQAFSSLTNFGLGVMVARSVDAREFGAFGLVFAVYLLALGASRSVHSDPLVVRYSDASTSSQRTAIAESLGATIVLATVLGAICAVGAALAPGSVSASFLALGVSLPGLLVQDAWRWAFITTGRSGHALLNDIVWAAALFPALVVMQALGEPSVAALILAWGLAATLAAVVGVVQSAVTPRPTLVRVWWRAHRGLALRILGEFAATSSAAELSVFVVGFVSGLATVGALRAGLILAGPVNVVLMGAITVSVAEWVRLLGARPERVWRSSALLSSALLVAAGGWGLLVVALPDDVGRRLLGDSWSDGRSVVVGVVAFYAASGVASGAVIGVRALGAAHRALRVRAAAAPVVVAAALLGASINGAVGAAWGLAAANAATAAAWWWQYHRALAEHRAGAGLGVAVESGAPWPTTDVGSAP